MIPSVPIPFDLMISQLFLPTSGRGSEHGPAGRGAVLGGHLTLVVDHDSPETKSVITCCTIWRGVIRGCMNASQEVLSHFLPLSILIHRPSEKPSPDSDDDIFYLEEISVLQWQ